MAVEGDKYICVVWWGELLILKEEILGSKFSQKIEFWIKISIRQECITVGCVPPACCPYLPACTAGGYLSGLGGTCWASGGVPGLGGGCTCLVLGGEVPGPGGGTCLVLGGGGVVPAWSGGVPAHPPPVDRILDTRFWKYYLAPNFVCGR